MLLAGIIKVSDFLEENNQFYSWNELQENDIDSIPLVNIKVLITKQHPSQYVYNSTIPNRSVNMYKYKEKWELLLDMFIDFDEYLNSFARIDKVTHVVKLRNFQYQLLLNKIFTNDLLFKWKIMSTDKCENCNQIQTIKYLLLDCTETTRIWETTNLLFKDCVTQ